MRRVVKSSWFFWMLFLCIGFGSVGFCAELAPSAEIIAAARQGLVDFPGLTGASLQEGFQVYTATPAALMSNDDLGAIMIPTGQWRFVVTCGEQPMGLLTVAQVEGQWQAVSLGGAGLATEMSRVLKTWDPGNGYNFRFVRVYQAMTDLVEISRANDSRKQGYVPLTSARASLGIRGEFAPGVLLNDAEIILPLRDAVAKNINMFEAQPQK
ncbi:MAG: hypothetical protein QG657_5137 [Acidobacteriota bacterium]|nr:hypothetical protein [Acidobacteriota bacterium]